VQQSTDNRQGSTGFLQTSTGNCSGSTDNLQKSMGNVQQSADNRQGSTGDLQQSTDNRQGSKAIYNRLQAIVKVLQVIFGSLWSKGRWFSLNTVRNLWFFKSS